MSSAGAIRAGQLRHPVVIQEATETRDGAGGITKSWADLDNVYADISPNRGREYRMGEQTRADISHYIYIRNYPSLTTQHRIKWNDNGNVRYFLIESAIDIEERDRKMQLSCKETV